MAKVSSKRQITLPVELCNVAHISAGDDVESFVDRQGVISIVKKQSGAANGLLKNIAVDDKVTEQQSLRSAINS
jgi:bifunctional DNA-binding transcriptional regulator/antitoxin component of YhaV-PrlF toxin-antitoxin module